MQASCNLQILASRCCKNCGMAKFHVMMLHAMQCTGPSCKILQIPSNLRTILCGIEILTPHDQHIAHRCFYTEGCLYTGMVFYTGAFTHRCFSQRHAFIQRCFSQRHAFTHKRLRIQMLLRGDAFPHSYLYAQVLYTGTLL